MIVFARKQLRIFLKFIGRIFFLPIIYRYIKRPNGLTANVSVHMLISSKSWKLGVVALSSLEFFSKRRWDVFFHDDGSLSEENKKSILSKLPGVNLVNRMEADARIGDELAKFAACKRNRLKHNLFLKFFDPYFYAPNNKYLIIDSDLFFYKFPKAIVNWMDSKDQTCFYNLDPTELYAISRDKIENKLKIQIWDRFNSGLVCISKSVIDMQLSESLLLEFENNAIYPQFFEQTLYALNASSFNRGGPLPPQYEISWNIFRRFDSVCRHYVGGAKDDHLYFEAPINLFFLMTIPSFFRKI